MSTSDRVTIYVPCDVISIRVKLGYADTLTPLEQIVLRAVHAGVRTLGELTAVLGLPQRMLVDLAQDLWKAGHLLITRSNGGVRVSDDVARRITAGTLAKLASAEMLSTTRQLMVDKLIDEVRPVTGVRVPVDRRFAVPVENSPSQLDTLSSAELLAALERDLDREARQRARHTEDGKIPYGPRRGQRIISAYLSPSALTRTEHRWLPVAVRPTVDPDNDDALVITVVDSDLPEAQRAAIAERLNHLARLRPKDEFFRTLRGQAVPTLVDAPSIADAIARLREQAITASTIPPGQRLSWQRSLLDLNRRLVMESADLARREVMATVVHGDEHTPALLDLITGARRQLVITAPWLRQNAVSALLPALTRALKAGVEIFVLWGINHDQTLTGDVVNLLYSALTQAPAGRLHLPGVWSRDWTNQKPGGGPDGLADEIQGSSRTHAKVAVADADRALVTSWNMLNSKDPRHELGLLVANPDCGPCGTVREILRWARSVVPDYETSRLMLVTEQDFRLGERPASADTTPRTTPVGPPSGSVTELTVIDPPPEPDDGPDEAATNAARGWSKAWVDHVDRLRAHLAAHTHPDARIVLDGAHRDVLKHAVRRAERRLVVASDQLSSRVVDHRFIDDLRKALDRGVQVVVRYKRPHPKEVPTSIAGAAPTPAQAALADLRSEYPDLLRVQQTADHAKFLVWDDEALVTSFNFLSFEGFYTFGAAHKLQSELGIRLAGGTVADELARSVGLTSTTERPAPAAPPAPDPSYQAAHLILNNAAQGDPRAALDRYLLAAPDPWRVLERLGEDADRALLRRAAATCLSLEPDRLDHTTAQRWARWLMDDLWNDGRYVEARLIRALVLDQSVPPRQPLATLAAARGHGSYPIAMSEALPIFDEPAGTARRRVAEAGAVLAAAVEQVLLLGGQDAEDTVDLVLSEIAKDNAESAVAPELRCWQVLARATLDYSKAADQISLPLAAIRQSLARRRDQDTHDQTWWRLATALQRAEHTQLDNSASLRTHMYLFTGVDGIFARLADIVASRRSGDLADWLANRDLRNVGHLIDSAAAVAAPGAPPMYGNYRRRYVKLLQTVIGEARSLSARLADMAMEPDQDEHVTNMLTMARPLARVIHDEHAGLVAFAESVDQPEGRFVRSVIESFDVLAVWGNEEFR